MIKPSDFYYIGRKDGEPIDEARHFHRCQTCDQAVDKRDGGQVFHHKVRGHLPLPGMDETPAGAVPSRH